MNTLKGENVRPFTKIHTDFLDCEILKSKQKLILLLLMHYGGIRSKDSKEFPTASTLARKTGMSVRSVRYVIAKLLDYKLIVKSVRYDRSGRKKVVYDSPEIWQSLWQAQMWQTTLEPVPSKSTGKLQCLSPAKKYKLYKSSINKSIHFVQRRLSSSTRVQRVTAQLNLSRE